MTEKECNQWLSNADYCVQQNVKISIPSIEGIADTSMSTVKTDIHILPLCLENNATLTGTSAILNQFVEEFTLSNKVDKLETLPFDKKNGSFSLKKAREHVEFLTMLFQHRDEMSDLLKTLEPNDKEFDSSNDDEDDEDLMDDCDDDNGTTIEQAKNRFAKCDQAFSELCNSIVDKVYQSKQNDSVESIIQDLTKINLAVRDHLGHTLLHMAVEQGNYDVVCCLMQAGLVGDQGTCKTIRGVMDRASAYEWAGIIPGDLHNKGYLCEACFTEQGPGGFHYICNKVMKRPKLITDASKKKKFETGNQDRIKEAVQDCAKSYGMAAVFEFLHSDFYLGDWTANLRKTGNHDDVLYDAFIRWVEQCCERNVAFKYYARMFLYYGPLLELFEISTSHVLGQAREVCNILHLPTYAHLISRTISQKHLLMS